MNSNDTQSTDASGLLAFGTSSRWDISIDEFLDRDEWSCQIESPQTYLAFQLEDLNVVQKAFSFLQGHLQAHSNNGQIISAEETSIKLGRFGNAEVSLIWDDEDFVRCFLSVGLSGQSTFRVSFDADDVKMLLQALDQVVKEVLSDGSSEVEKTVATSEPKA